MLIRSKQFVDLRALSSTFSLLSLPIMILSFLLAQLSFGFVLISFAASTKHYEVGSVYHYDYVLRLEMNEPSEEQEGSVPAVSSSSSVGYKIITKVDVKPVWHNEGVGSLLEITLVKPKLQIKSARAPEPEGFRDHSSNLDNSALIHHPFFILLKDGKVQSTFAVKGDDPSLVNVKKGLGNLLQVQGQSASVRSDNNNRENTPLGVCRVQYDVKDQFRLTKRFNSSACEISDELLVSRTHNNPVLGVGVESEVISKVSLSRDLGVVGEVETIEKHVVRVNVKREIGAVIEAEQILKLIGSQGSSPSLSIGTSLDSVIKEIETSRNVNLIKDGLIPKWDHFTTQFCDAQQTSSCSNSKSVDALKEFLVPENIATTKLASAFLQLVSKFRELKTIDEKVKGLLKPGSRIFPQVLDAAAASGSVLVHQAVMKTLNFDADEENIALPERYLLGLSLSPNPAPEVLQDLFKLVRRSGTLPSRKLQESLTLTMASVAHTISERNKRLGLQQGKILREIEEYLITSLSSCEGETSSECRQLYLRALKNLKSPATVPILFQALQNSGDQKSALVAMKSLQSFPDSYIISTHRPELIKIIYQIGTKKKYDSSVRTLALDLILRSNPNKDELRDIISFLLPKLVDKDHSEVATFFWHRIHEFSERNPALKQHLEEVLTQQDLRTYHHLSPRGLSTAFSRYFISTPNNGNSSFSNAIEMNGNILKRSAFDVEITTDPTLQGLQLLSLGIFADGLASFANDGDNSPSPHTTLLEEEKEPEPDATAGMELTLLGQQMRPLVFFVGTGELMGLVWSGAGSERTSAILGNVLLQDEKRMVPLFNGLVAEVNIQGGLSFDFAGQVQISLWHRTANSLVENKAGLVLQSVIRADTTFVQSRVDYTLAAEAALHFTSDINFYQGVLMCLKLTQPEFKIRQNIYKTERIPGSKHKLRKAKYKTTPVPGITYALNRKNNELCGLMYKDKDEL